MEQSRIEPRGDQPRLDLARLKALARREIV
jgi:hypothetical protein